MEMLMLVAAAGSAYLANCWHKAYKTSKASTDDGDLGSRTRERNACPVDLNSSPYQVEDYANPIKFWINGEICSSSPCADKEKPNVCTKAQNPLFDLSNSNLGVIIDEDRLGERIRQQEIYQEWHYGEGSESLANSYAGEFGLGRRNGTWKRRSSPYRGRGRGRVLRAAALKPMTPLESCFINYEINDSGFLSCGRQRPLVVTDGSRIVSRGGGISPLPSAECGLPFHNNINTDEPEVVIGLPSLTKGSQCSRNDCVMKRRKTSEYDPSTLSGLQSNKHLPLQDTSAGYLLICFGVGIGIMSTIMSSKREIERLSCLLRQREELVEDLEEELEMRACWTVKDVTDEACNCLATWRHPLGKEQGKMDATLDALSKEVCKVDERTSLRDPVKNMENITSVEAELEAELEKLELNLNTSKHQRKFSRTNEIGPDCIADVVSGELREDGLIYNAESEEDNRSTHDEVITGNFSVSPRDLERRLHELMIARLQERIIELEAELEGSQNKLQAIELGQQQSKELNQTSQSLHSDPEVLTRISGYLENQLDLPADKRNSSKAYSKIPINQKKIGKLISKELLEGIPIGVGLADRCYSESQTSNLNKADTEDFNVQSVDVEDSRENKNLPLFLSLSGDALSAYTEAYDEFMKITLEKGTNMFDSAEVEDAKLSKQSVSVDNCHCYVESESQHKDGKHILHLESRPSLSTNFWNAGGLNSCFSQGISTSRGTRSFTSPKKMDLEFEGIALKNSDFLENVVEDTSGSTPCSLKFVDTTDLINSDFDHYKFVSMNVASEPENIMVNTNTLCMTDGSRSTRVSNLEASQLPMPSVHQTTGGKGQSSQFLDDLSVVSTSVLDKIRSWGSIGIEGELEGDAGKDLSSKVCKMPGSLPSVFDNSNSISDESDYSEADERLGTLLIKRIVEKTRQGFSIVQEAESILASFDKND